MLAVRLLQMVIETGSDAGEVPDEAPHYVERTEEGPSFRSRSRVGKDLDDLAHVFGDSSYSGIIT